MKNNRLTKMTLLVMILPSLTACRHKPLQQAIDKANDTISFRKDIMPVFISYCLGSGCHSGANAAAGLDLSTDSIAYTSLVRKKDIETATPEMSFLYQEMNSSATPMPPTGRLNDNYINTVLKWLRQGAEEN